MKNVIIRKILAVVGGFVGASLVMMLFECINSFFYKFPSSMDPNNIEQLRAFSASLPWTAYVLVFVGWAAGAFVAGYLVSAISKEEGWILAGVEALLLVFAGWTNDVLLRDAIPFYVLETFMLPAMTYLGSRFYFRKRSRS
jgi:hypothetical protein